MTDSTLYAQDMAAFETDFAKMMHRKVEAYEKRISELEDQLKKDRTYWYNQGYFDARIEASEENE